MTIYQQKLLSLEETASLVSGHDLTLLAQDFRSGSQRVAYAVGSGGSQVSADFFALCRASITVQPTITATPIDLVLGEPAPGSDVWLFSAGADNGDIEAAFRAALDSMAANVILVSVRSSGRVVELAAEADPTRCRAYILPTFDPKDGFLATHSVVATISALAAATCPSLTGGQNVAALVKAVRCGLADTETLGANIRPDDTLLVLYDPNLKSIMRELETSILESGLCHVQSVDLRNFAHGRHVWLDKRGDRTKVLALVSNETQAIWNHLDRLIPESVERLSWLCGSAGPRDNLVGVVRAFRLVETIGRSVGIDPAKPGVASYARAIYEDEGLVRLAESLGPAVRHKRRAISQGSTSCDRPLSTIRRERIEHLTNHRYRGIVLDYDGTIVDTDRRREQPDPLLVAELDRLLNGGIALAIATGRGGSAGEMLRTLLPVAFHDAVTMGYYNGSLICPLSRDIALVPPAPDIEIIKAADHIRAEVAFRGMAGTKFGPVQITIDRSDLADPAAFDRQLGSGLLAGFDVRVLRSQHSLDVVRSEVNKSLVVRAIAGAEGELVDDMLCIGDSGAHGGNDSELLEGRSSISVQEVCDNPEGSWTVFGTRLTGPAALLRILSAFRIEKTGHGRIDPIALGLDE